MIPLTWPEFPSAGSYFFCGDSVGRKQFLPQMLNGGGQFLGRCQLFLAMKGGDTQKAKHGRDGRDVY